MKIWKFVLLAAVAGFIHGATCSEPPFAGLQKASLSISRLPMSWLANRLTHCSHIALTNHRNIVCPHRESRDTAPIKTAVRTRSETTGSRVLDAGINESSDWKSDLETKGRMASLLLTESGLSVDAKSSSLLSLLEALSEKYDIEIVGKDALADKVMSAKFDAMNVENGIRQLMRIAGVANYALSYRSDAGGRDTVSQIILLPAEDNEFVDNGRLAEAEQAVDSRISDQLETPSLGKVAAEIPGEILADFKAEIQAEVPADMRTDILADMLGEPQK